MQTFQPNNFYFFGRLTSFFGGFSASRIFFGGFLAQPNFSAAAAKFGG
jgi:hypothetical protein